MLHLAETQNKVVVRAALLTESHHNNKESAAQNRPPVFFPQISAAAICKNVKKDDAEHSGAHVLTKIHAAHVTTMCKDSLG